MVGAVRVVWGLVVVVRWGAIWLGARGGRGLGWLVLLVVVG